MLAAEDKDEAIIAALFGAKLIASKKVNTTSKTETTTSNHSKWKTNRLTN